MVNESEDKVSKFYNTVGWEAKDGITEDARKWEDLRDHAKLYVSKCRMRVLNHIPGNGVNMLDMASGPIQYREYLEYSRNFKKRYCIDLSSKALENAKNKIGDHGVFLHGSFFDISLEENFFDCVVSLHTIYHIDKDRQEEAVRTLIKVTKIGKPIIIVYSNPNTFTSSLEKSLLLRVLRRAKHGVLRRIKHVLKKTGKTTKKEEGSSLYFYSHPIEWWNRFNDVANVSILPWRSFEANIQKKLIPDNKIGEVMFSVLYKLEERFPDFFVKHFRYPMIILTKTKKQ